MNFYLCNIIEKIDWVKNWIILDENKHAFFSRAAKNPENSKSFAMFYKKLAKNLSQK